MVYCLFIPDDMRKRLRFLLCLALLCPLYGAKGEYTLSLSFGIQTVSPFTYLVEDQFRSIIDQELKNLTSWATPLLNIGSISEEMSFSSNGWAVNLSASRSFSRSPWSLCLEFSWLSLNLPYILDDQQTINLVNTPLLSISSQASGTARIRSIESAVILQYRLLETSPLSVHLAAGVHVLPMLGRIDLMGSSTLTIADSRINLSLSSDSSLSELRQQGFDIPKVLFYPSLSLRLHGRLTAKHRLVAKLSLSQGLFAALGLAVCL